MGYACPVCETPQADARHLANHLAFTALLGDTDHESWLDEHVPGWEESGEHDLAERVEKDASAVEYPQVFEDTTDRGHRHSDEPRPGDLFDERPTHGLSGEPNLDAETAAAIEQARAMSQNNGGEKGEDESASDEDENG